MEPNKKEEKTARYKATSHTEKKIETKPKNEKTIKGQEMGSAKFKKH